MQSGTPTHIQDVKSAFVLLTDNKIKNIKAIEVLDCRGNPTVEVQVLTEKGISDKAIVPSGMSTGIHESVEIRDGEKRYLGKGVRTAVNNVNNIIFKNLKDRDITNQEEIDKVLIEIDGTENKSTLGSNATTAVSIAIAKTAAKALQIPIYEHIGNKNSHVLPIPFMNLINGGKHAGSDLAFQEFIIAPINSNTYEESLVQCVEVYKILREIILKKFDKYAINVGDEAGYTPRIKTPEEALDLLHEAVKESGYTDIFKYALDSAASHIYDSNRNRYRIYDDKELSKEELIEYYKELVNKYNIISIEDPLDQEDFEGFTEITSELSIQIVGDDLFVSNPHILEKGVKMSAANAVLLKVNQIGTLTEALETTKIALTNNYRVMVSERSGDTEDDFLSDLTVAINAGQIKTGAPARSERTSKYNQLLRIEQELGNKAEYGGKFF